MLGGAQSQEHTESLEVILPTSGSIHDTLDVEEQRSEPHLQQQLVAVVQADAQSKVPLHHPLLGTLKTAGRSEM